MSNSCVRSADNDSATEWVPLSEATRRFFGPHISSFSVRRWCVVGVGQPPVKLRSLRVGGRYFTCEAYAREFLDAVSNPELYHRCRKTERVEKAKKRLQRAGA